MFMAADTTSKRGVRRDSRGMDTRRDRLLLGLAAGLLGMLCTIMRPMLKEMDGRDFRNFMEAWASYSSE
jgi:hypothetical protein